MKRFLSAAIFSLVGLLVLAQSGCTNAPSPPATNVNTAAPEATPDEAEIRKELLRIENDWPRIMKERDGQAVRRLDADDVHLLSWDGSLSTKEEDAKFIESGAITSDSFEMNELQVKILDKDAAVVTGMIDIKGGKYKAPDRTIDVSGQYRFVDTFARRNNEWKLVASTSVKVLNPTAPTASPTPKASPVVAASPVTKPSPSTKETPSTKATPIAKPSPARRPSPLKPAPTPVKTQTP